MQNVGCPRAWDWSAMFVGWTRSSLSTSSRVHAWSLHDFPQDKFGRFVASFLTVSNCFGVLLKSQKLKTYGKTFTDGHTWPRMVKIVHSSHGFTEVIVSAVDNYLARRLPELLMPKAAWNLWPVYCFEILNRYPTVLSSSRSGENVFFFFFYAAICNFKCCFQSESAGALARVMCCVIQFLQKKKNRKDEMGKKSQSSLFAIEVVLKETGSEFEKGLLGASKTHLDSRCKHRGGRLRKSTVAN